MITVFSDIDGTFHSPGSEIAPINLEAIAALQKQGDHFVFVSGRGCHQIVDLLTKAGQDCDMIFSNGAGYKLVGEAPVYENCLSIADCVKVLEIVEKEDIFYHIHTSEGIFLKPMHHYQTHLQKLRKKFETLGEQGTVVMDFKENYFTNECGHHEDLIGFFKENPEIHILKVELMDADDQIREQLIGKLASTGLYTFSSFFTALEVVHPHSNKGAAIQNYLAKMPSEKTYGIGDAENDFAMLEVVDVPVAVENATAAIKEKCQMVIGPCDSGGVGQFIFDQLILDK
ncbi:HAD-IIB family hydrolase [Isobaculum melis]|nr:HAD-IIB family hydrolase [Isobaculum melis]